MVRRRAPAGDDAAEDRPHVRCARAARHRLHVRLGRRPPRGPTHWRTAHQRTGIRQRHIAAEGEFTSHLATKAADRTAVRTGDYIVAIVNQELVTAVEISLRTQRAREESLRLGVKLPPEEDFKRQMTEALIDERAILTFARENGARIEDPELDRALQAIAAQNQLTVDQLRERLKAEGMDFARYRANLRDQLNVERTREREVYGRIRTTDADIERHLNQQKEAAALEAGLNLAQILISVPDGASLAQVSERRALVDRALARAEEIMMSFANQRERVRQRRRAHRAARQNPSDMEENAAGAADASEQA